MFVQVLIQKGYRLVSRSDMQALLKEQAFQNSGLTDDNAVAAGKILNVPGVLLVGVTQSTADPVIGRRPGMSGSIARAAVGARLVDVATGEVRWTHAEYKTRSIAGKKSTADLLAEVAKDVAQFLPPEPDSPGELLKRATQLKFMGQVTSARQTYRNLIDRFSDSAESRKAATRLKSLGG